MKFWLLALGLVGGLCGASQLAKVPPQWISSPPAVMPAKLANAGIVKPTALVKVLIDDAGQVVDAVCVTASHVEMAFEAERIALKSLFRPARENRRPSYSVSALNIEFAYMGDFTLTTSQAQMAALKTEFAFRKDRLELSEWEDLDEEPRLLVQPVHVRPILRDRTAAQPSGKAIVEGFIDIRGRLRVARIVSSDHDGIASAALKAFANVRFAPPTRQGRPTVVRIRLPYILE